MLMSMPLSPAAAVRRAMMGTAARVRKKPAPDIAADAATAHWMAGSRTLKAGHRATSMPARAMKETWACLDRAREEGDVVVDGRARARDAGVAVKLLPRPPPAAGPERRVVGGMMGE